MWIDTQGNGAGPGYIMDMMRSWIGQFKPQSKFVSGADHRRIIATYVFCGLKDKDGKTIPWKVRDQIFWYRRKINTL